MVRCHMMGVNTFCNTILICNVVISLCLFSYLSHSHTLCHVILVCEIFCLRRLTFAFSSPRFCFYTDFSTADCLQSENDTKGETYRGTLSQTISGLECQPWTATYPHIPSPVFLLGLVPHLTGNRCRNPFGMRPKPWCYTTDPRQRWEVCDVKVCSSDSSRGKY